MRTAGFTLLEILVVIAVIGILVTLSMRIPRDPFAVRAAASSLSSQVTRARMEALRRNEYVGLKVERATQRFFLFEDRNRSLAYEASSDVILPATLTLLKTNDYSGVQMASSMAQSEYTFVYDTRGIPRSLTEISVPLQNLQGTYSRTVSVNLQGRSQVQ